MIQSWKIWRYVLSTCQKICNSGNDFQKFISINKTRHWRIWTRDLQVNHVNNWHLIRWASQVYTSKSIDARNFTNIWIAMLWRSVIKCVSFDVVSYLNSLYSITLWSNVLSDSFIYTWFCFHVLPFTYVPISLREEKNRQKNNPFHDPYLVCKRIFDHDNLYCKCTQSQPWPYPLCTVFSIWNMSYILTLSPLFLFFVCQRERDEEEWELDCIARYLPTLILFFCEDFVNKYIE